MRLCDISIVIFNVVLPVFLIVALGYLFGKIKKIDLSAVNDFVIYLATPALILSSLAEDTIDISLASTVFISVCIIVVVTSVVGYITIKKMGLPIKVYLSPILFANTGNMGLPLILFAFGDTGFNIGILYLVSTTFLHYTVGIMILNYDKSPVEIFKLPLIYSAVLGVLLSVTHVHMPVAIFRAIDLLGEASIPTMIFALGYKLSEIRLTDTGKSFLFGGMRILVGVTAGLFVVTIFKIQGVTAQVIILQSAMPPAVFNFVLAEKYNQDSKTVASIILAGTILSVITTPIILSYLL